MPIPSPSERPDLYDDFDCRPGGEPSAITTPPEIQHLIDERRAVRSLQIKAEVGKYFIHSIAESAEKKLIKRVIRFLQRSVPGLLEDQGAQNLWDEICIQTQNDDSPFSELYSEHIEKLLEKLAEQLSETERVALWLVTYSGECLLDTPGFGLKIPKDMPVKNLEIARHLVQSVLNEAMNYENKRIRALTGR